MYYLSEELKNMIKLSGFYVNKLLQMHKDKNLKQEKPAKNNEEGNKNNNNK